MVKNVLTVSANGFCISCGACVHACANGNVFMDYARRQGQWQARVRDEAPCQNCRAEDNCLAVCPGYRVDYQVLAASDENRLLGRIVRVCNGHADDALVRVNSSSGGFIRMLCRSLLEEREVSGVVALAHAGGLEFFPRLVTDPGQMPNSIYHNVNYQNAFALLLGNEGRFLLIGLPCQLTALSLLLKKKRFAALESRIHGLVALVCGFTFDRVNAEAFSYYNRFRMEEISYREQGRFRKTRISNKEGSLVFDVRRPRTAREMIHNMLFFDQFLPQRGCLFCVDHLGYTADLTVGDAWQKCYGHDLEGTNLIIVRTSRGAGLLQHVRGFHFEDGSVEEIIEAQGPDYALAAIGAGMAAAGRKAGSFYPEYKRTDAAADIVARRLRVKDRLKLAWVKRLLHHRRFRLARLLYTLLEWKAIVWFFIGKIKGRGLKPAAKAQAS